MTVELLQAVRRYTEAHADHTGLARTAIAGVTLVRATVTGELQYAIHRPLVCLIVQGAKEVTSGSCTAAFNAGSTMVTAADVPTVTRITQASRSLPYLSVAFYLDSALIADLSERVATVPLDIEAQFQRTDAEPDLADTALRMIRLLERPHYIPLLQREMMREMHVWLLAGRHASALRKLGAAEGHDRRIARVVQAIRSEFASRLPIDRLASMAGMSPSTFHHHFRAVTSLTPLQFQKQIRLIEARRMMLASGVGSSGAAYAVGYESVPQFIREYSRFFGSPPVRDIETARRKATGSLDQGPQPATASEDGEESRHA